MVEYHPIKYFAPGWFAMIMGTGGLANICYLWGQHFAVGRYIGTALGLLAAVCFLLALIPWLGRWIFYYPYVKRDLQHPVTTNFFVTMPVGTAIIGTNIHIIWSQYLGESLAYGLMFGIWVFAIVGVSYFTFYTTFRFMRDELPPKPETMNFSWIMAPIANMAVLLIGNPVLGLTIERRPSWAISVFIMNIALLGIGFFLFIFIGAIIFVRLAQHPLPPAETTPSFGILLGAVGLSVNTINDLSGHAVTMGILTSTDLPNMVSAAIWGFGIWVAGIIFIICIHHLRRGGIPFNLGWWAFIFPLAVYTMASLKVSNLYITPLTNGFALFLTLLLGTLWIYIFTNTVRGIISRKLFMGTPINGAGN